MCRRHASRINLFGGKVIQICSLLVAAACLEAHGQGTLAPLTTFGSNGWLAPWMNPYLSTANTERGLGWNPVTKNLVLPSRNGGNFVAILDGTTGDVVKTLDTTGVSGGTLALMGAGVSDDGEIYAANLQIGSLALSPFKIYRWSSENDVNPPTIAFSHVNPATTTGGWRFGDAFAVHGSGTGLKFAAAGATTGTSSGLPNNGNFMIGALDGSNANTIYRSIPGTSTASNDYRLGLTFVDSDTLIGTQGTTARITDFTVPTISSTTQVISASNAIISGSVAIGLHDRHIAYTELNGRRLLAVLSSSSAVLSVYDITNPSAATFLTSGSTVSGTLVPNGNASGGLQWGETLSPVSRAVYALSTNRGIQAMVFSLPGITVSVSSGTQTQAAAGYPSLEGDLSLVKTGEGTLFLNEANTLSGSTTVQGGTLLLGHGSALRASFVTPLTGGTLAVSTDLHATVAGLNPNAGGVTDVGSGRLSVVAGLSSAELLTALRASRLNGSWTGTSGITSTTAAALVAQGMPRTVGWLDNGDGSMTVGFAAPGDTNIDGLIDIIDVGVMVGSERFGTGEAVTWRDGDFNYDGFFDILDAAAMMSTDLYDAGNYNSDTPRPSNVTAVPEPASTTILLTTCGCILAIMSGRFPMLRIRH
jgi:autotransporter-associated beta strand protein